MRKLPAAGLLFFVTMVPVRAGERRGLPPESDLYRTVAALDTAVFDAFNHC
jgi:hypothetical protein